jgi:hypothetical protein
MNFHQTTGAAEPLLPKAPDQRFAPVHPLAVECQYVVTGGGGGGYREPPDIQVN